MKAAIAVLLVVGCSDGASLGGPCSLTDLCGDGAVCDFTAAEGPTCISASGDLDGDGLTNDKDYCNHAPGGAYDEDGDGVGDDCDRCPIAPPRANPDSDDDMVDAPCDPEPSEPGDELLLFDGFNGALDPRWKPTTATAWTGVGGEVVARLDTIDTQEYLQTTVVGKNSVAIEASYRVDNIESSSTQHLVGVYADDPRPAGVATMQCYVTSADTSQQELVVVESNSSAMSQMTSGAFASANLYRAGGYVTGTRASCVVLSNGNPLGTVQAAITPDQLSSIALTARAVTARFQYVIVVGR